MTTSSGVGEHWMGDGDARAIETYRLDRLAGAYRLVETCRPGGRATTPLLPGLAIDPADVFRDWSTRRDESVRYGHQARVAV